MPRLATAAKPLKLDFHSLLYNIKAYLFEIYRNDASQMASVLSIILVEEAVKTPQDFHKVLIYRLLLSLRSSNFFQ